MAHERIEINPGIVGGKPVVRGTRIPVETVLRKLGAGMTVDANLADHSRLTPADILATQSFAADYLADEDLVYAWACAGSPMNAWTPDWCVTPAPRRTTLCRWRRLLHRQATPMF